MIDSTPQSTIQIYNTMSRSKEPFTPIEPGIVRMYVCGVTPYDSAHIGHGMSAITFDVIRRWLEYRGYVVRHAQNFTDVDDKIIARAEREGIDPLDLVDRLIAEWLEENDSLGVQRATVYPRVTQEIGPIITTVQGLIDRGYAYEASGEVYYRVRAFADYGKLSRRTIDDLLSGARIDIDERKEDPLDFALWKASKPGEPSWESPWGRGRPGWHIECSAMAATYLDGELDIHGGGADLIFPHHENEVAQSEAYLGHEPFARYWVHNGMLQLRGEKMSKSLGNVVSIKRILDRGLGAAFRLLVLQTHYRSPLTYTEEGLVGAERGLERLRAAASAAVMPPPTGADTNQRTESELRNLAMSTRFRFESAMDDDFDTPKAVAALFDLGRAINREAAAGVDVKVVADAAFTLSTLSAILGLSLDPPSGSADGSAEPFIDLLVRVREDLRAAKHWQLADMIRDGLKERGIALEDGPTGATWKSIATA